MKTIVLTAQDFAYGPIGKLLDLISFLDGKKYKLVFIGFGSSLQLAKKHNFNKIYKLDTEVKENYQKLKKLIKGADLLISSMDIQSLKAAQSLKIPNVWLDCLFWFWDEIPKPSLKSTLYIREISLNSDKNYSKFSNKIDNLLSVGTILPKIKTGKKKKQALISLGGAESTHWYQFGKDTNFPLIMTEILTNYVEWTDFNKVYLATNKRIIPVLKKNFPSSPFIFKCLAHNDFIRILSESEVSLITPGLVTTQTAFHAKTPIIFLPASNNSQYLQLEEYRNNNLAPASVCISDFLDKLNFQGKEERESNEMVLNQIKALDKNKTAKKQIGNKLQSLIEERHIWSDKSIKKGQMYLKKRGSNGAIQAIAEIKTLIEKTSANQVFSQKTV